MTFRISNHNEQALLTPAQAASLLGVTTRTLLRWEDDGRIVPSRTPGGHRRYRREDLDALTERCSA